MADLTEKIVRERTGEPLEAEIRKNVALSGSRDQLKETVGKLTDSIGTVRNAMEAFEQVEEAWTQYDALYGETAYRLGLSDGIEVGKGKGAGDDETLLSLGDMTILVSIYDAVQELNEVLYGDAEIHQEEDGVMYTLGTVYDLISHGVCAGLKLLGDESAERLACILGEDAAPCERAKKLLGKDGGNAIED